MVLVILDNVKPYQDVSVSGLNGRSDFSQWRYTRFNVYAKLKFGRNKIIGKVECNNPLNMFKYDTITITRTKAFDSKQNKIGLNDLEELTPT